MRGEFGTDPNNRPIEILIDDARVSQMPDKIEWEEHDAKLVFTKTQEVFVNRSSDAEFPLYEMTGFVGGRTVPFTEKTGRKKILFAAADAFIMRDPEIYGDDTDYFIVFMNPKMLQKNIKHMLFLYHEIGHAHQTDQLLDVALLAVALTFDTSHLTNPQEFGNTAASEKIFFTKEKVKEYAKIVMENLYSNLEEGEIDQAFSDVEQGDEGLKRSILGRMKAKVKKLLLGGLLKNSDELDETPNVFGITAQLFFNIMALVDHELENSIMVFQEKEAWVLGWLMMIQDGFPNAFETEEEVLEYMNICLETYKKSRNDDRFVLP